MHFYFSTTYTCYYFFLPSLLLLPTSTSACYTYTFVHTFYFYFYFYPWNFNSSTSTSTSTSWLSISIYIVCNDCINYRSLSPTKSLQNITWITLTEFLVVRMELDGLFCREKVVPYQLIPKRKINPNINHTRKSLKMIFLSWVLLSNDTLT